MNTPEHKKKMISYFLDLKEHINLKLFDKIKRGFK